MAEDMDPAATAAVCAPAAGGDAAQSGSAHGRGGGKSGGKRKKPRTYVRYSPEVAVKLCARLARGELLYHIARTRGMPTAEAVAKWAKAKPDFAAALLEARRAGGRPAGTCGPAFTISEEVADEVFERLCEGQSLTAIGRDPTMPSLSTLFYWRRRFPEFEERVQLGMRIRAEVLSDEGWDMALAATPETAYLTGVRLGHLRWLAGVMAPRVFRLKTVEPERGPEVVKTLFRHFGVEVDPQTGERKVVAWCPNPETGHVEREDTPGWRPPAGYGRLPGGG
ncbi:hypothetical protein [Phenylobacterium sp.]|uniref:terminase small subunit-like protein n=1 Tax=Phenylobacterium sp. TaxID=1871053 RepID=UPI0025F6B110|nr:hypothetical protein [Phenylobacterium sp.]